MAILGYDPARYHTGRAPIEAAAMGLADRMVALPELNVQMFLNVQRRHRDTTQASELVREFVYRFKTVDWPGNRLPEVFYDPRSLEMARLDPSTAPLSEEVLAIGVEKETGSAMFLDDDFLFRLTRPISPSPLANLWCQNLQ
jgi:hypothetical protein